MGTFFSSNSFCLHPSYNSSQITTSLRFHFQMKHKIILHLQVGSTHRQFEKEEEAHKEMINFKIVKQKYFKEQVPNFLTWSEKEHIRHLHSKDPEEWTPDSIAEAFPTTPEGAQVCIYFVVRFL